MISLAKLSIRHPKSALAVWLIVGIGLSLIGLGVARTLSPSITVVPGTQSSQAQHLANAQFGPTQLVPILLEGPRTQLDRQGPHLVAALARRPHTRVLSAWDAGTASAGLRPKPNAAMIVVSVDRTEANAVKYDQPQIEKLVAHKISAPVHPYITGQPSIDRAEKNASLSGLRQNEVITIGILFVLLLIGLRAPVAALVVTAVGAISTLAGFGEVALLGHILKLDPVGVAAGTMTGLALAVSFALLILDRFHREEYPPGAHPREPMTAALRELESTGKAVLIAGTAVILALALVAVIGPTELMVSVGTGALTCAAFATGGAVVVMPAALVLLGRRIDALSFPAPASLSRAWSKLVDGGNWVTRQAVYAVFAATVLLGLLAVPAFALNSGPPDVSQLPPSSQARIAFEEVSRVMGPGWPTPYNVILVANNRPITTPALLGSVYGFERQIAQDKTVYSVTGPGAINTTSSQLKSFAPGLKHSVKLSDQSKKDLLRLADGLKQAGAGSSQMQSSLAQAASGSGLLHSGSGQLHGYLVQAQNGSKRLMAGLNQALTGAVALRNGSAQALSGANQLENGLAQAQNGAKPVVPGLNALAGSAATASSQVNAALAQLGAMTTGKSDPSYAAVQHSLQSASASAAGTSALASAAAKQAPALVSGIDQLHAGSAQLQAGIEQLRNGNAQLASGIGQIVSQGSALPSALTQLSAGAATLENGIGQLETGLAGGVPQVGQLTSGLGLMQAAVIKSRGQIPSTAQLKQLFAQSPGMFNSGYFVLAAVEGATRSDRNAASFTINLLRGGTAGQIMVVSRYKANDPRSEALATRLDRLTGGFARAHNLQAAVGGPAGNLRDLTQVTNSKVWIDIAVVAAALLLVLALALRALLIPLVATVFSLLVVAATFGGLQLLFGGTHPPLDGPGYLDPITIISVFTVAFSITIVFSTILLMRTREEYLAGAGDRGAVRRALRETAAATTGAGVLTVAVLIPFTLTQLLNVRALGIGVACAVLLDVLIVRPVLLPAAEAVLGRYGWWPTKPPGSPEARPARTDEAAGSTRRSPRLRLPHTPPPAAQ